MFSLSKKDQIFLLACGCWCWFSSCLSGSINKCLLCFETLGIALSTKRFVLVGLTTYVSTYIAGLVGSDHALYQIPAITWSLKEICIIPLLLLFLTPTGLAFGLSLSKAASSKG